MPDTTKYPEWTDERAACWTAIHAISWITHDDLPLAIRQATQVLRDNRTMESTDLLMKLNAAQSDLDNALIKVTKARVTEQGWLDANAPGGWIDQLRTDLENANIRIKQLEECTGIARMKQQQQDIADLMEQNATLKDHVNANAREVMVQKARADALQQQVDAFVELERVEAEAFDAATKPTAPPTPEEQEEGRRIGASLTRKLTAKYAPELLEAESTRDRAQAEATALVLAKRDVEARLAECRVDLIEYGRHAPGCSAQFDKGYRCKCGWAEVEAALAGKGE